MIIELWCIGKTSFSFVQSGLGEFENRLKHYCQFKTVIIEGVKTGRNDTPDIVAEKEGNVILKKIDDKDHLILLDERGEAMNSIEFAGFIENKMLMSYKKLIFLVGGAYGFSDKIYRRANEKISLSKMTFSHQLIRLIFAEQLYRAFTIVRNEKYHNY